MKNSIKCIQVFLLALFILTGFSCSDDDEKVVEELLVSTETISLPKTATTKAFHIKTNNDWTITSSDAAYTVSPSSGQGTGTIKIELTATENMTNDARSATLTVKSGTITKQIVITQALTTLLNIKKSVYDLTGMGEDITVEMQSTATPEVKIIGDWITPKNTKAVSDQSFGFSIASNNFLQARQGEIIFIVGDLSDTVKINQAGQNLSIAADKTGMESDALVLAKKLKIGWNLGNSLEAASSSTSANETLWGNARTTKTLIDAVKAAGFNTVRIPCAWSGYIEDQETYKIKDSWLARVKEVVDYCKDNDMYVILNIHWDGGWLEENPLYSKQVEVNKKQKALWEQIAVYFRDYDEHLLFAGTNEVHANYGTPTTENITVQESYNQTFVDAVRSTGGKNTWRNLIVQSYNTNVDYAVNYLTMSTDPTAKRMMAEVHYYDPYDFALDEKSGIYLWGKDFSGAGVSSWGQEAWVDTQFGKIKTHFVDKGIPVILGEYAAMLQASLTGDAYLNHVKARNYYLNYVTKAALQNGMVPVYWDSGATGNNASGLFDRATGTQVHADAIAAIVSAAN